MHCIFPGRIRKIASVRREKDDSAVETFCAEQLCKSKIRFDYDAVLGLLSAFSCRGYVANNSCHRSLVDTSWFRDMQTGSNQPGCVIRSCKTKIGRA